jgi:SAM-dependent methyltransferase
MRDWLSCPVCGNAEAETLYVHRPSRYVPGEAVTCRSCRTLYKRPDNRSLDAANLYIGEYEDGFANVILGESEAVAMQELGEILEVLVRLKGNRGRLLDIGCGPGKFLRLAKNAGFEPYGIEVNPTLAQECRERAGATVFTNPAETLPSMDAGQFDVVTMLDFIEHVRDPTASVATAKTLLKPDGVLVVFTPNHRGLIVRIARALYALTGGRLRGPADEIFDTLHVTYFDTTTLQQLLQNNSLSVVEKHLVPFRPERRNQTSGVMAAALRTIELASRFVPDGPFRVLMFGQPSR